MTAPIMGCPGISHKFSRIKQGAHVGACDQVCYNGPMTFIVDGHNLIGQMTDLALDDPEDEEKLIGRLQRYQARTGRKIVVVFDPGCGFRLSAKQTVGAVKVVYAGTGITADEVIIHRVRSAVDPRTVTVVSSDREIQNVANQSGALVVDAAAFVKEMEHGHRRRPRRKKRSTIVSDPTAKPLPDREVKEWLQIFGQSGQD